MQGEMDDRKSKSGKKVERVSECGSEKKIFNSWGEREGAEEEHSFSLTDVQKLYGATGTTGRRDGQDMAYGVLVATDGRWPLLPVINIEQSDDRHESMRPSLTELDL